jgi:hypothetical protein
MSAHDDGTRPHGGGGESRAARWRAWWRWRPEAISARFVALVAGIIFFFLAVLTQGVLPFIEPSARTSEVTAVVRTDYGRFEPGGLRDRTGADHFDKCPVGGALLDLRDQAQMLAHVHDAEIEICEGPGPPRQGQLH